MERQRSAVDRLKDLKRQLAQARDRHIADATSEPAILYPKGPAKAKRSPDEQRRREQGSTRRQSPRPDQPSRVPARVGGAE
jgi:hypothetical protein